MSIKQFNIAFPFEILVHDDASTDGTQDIIREYEKAYPKIFKVIYQKENQYTKYNKSLNAILTKFQFPRYKGKYAANCNGDDYWSDPDKLQRQVDFLKTHPDYSCTCHPVAMIEGGKFSKTSPELQIANDTDIPPNIMIASGGLVHDCSLVYRVDAIKNLPKYYSLADVEDLPLKYHMAISGKVFYFIKVMAAIRLAREGSWTKKANADREFMAKHAKNMLPYLVAFNTATEEKYAAEIARQTEYYVNLISNSEYKSSFPKFNDFLKNMAEKQNEITNLKTLARIKDDEANRKQEALLSEFIEGAAKALII